MYEMKDLDPVRAKNLDTIDKFFNRHRLNGENISVLFTSDGIKQFYRPNGELWQYIGTQSLADNYTSNKKVFTGWKYAEVKYYVTDDPDFFWALTYGSGGMKLPEYEGPYSNYYIDAFFMEDGLIKEFTEYNNPEHLLKDFMHGKLAGARSYCEGEG